MNTSLLNPEKWGFIFTLLSMDIVAPFYFRMGVDSLPPEQFMPMLRQCILGNRKAYIQNPSAIPQLASEVFKQTQSRWGEQNAKRLFKWAVHTFKQVHLDQPQWSAWQLVFFWWSVDRKLSKPMGVTAERRAGLMSDYRQLVFVSDVEQEIQVTKAALLSDWDLEMYALHNFSDEVQDPLDPVMATTEIHRFQSFWRGSVTSLPKEEQESLWEHAQPLLENKGVYMPEPLRSPGSMEELLP